MHQVKGKRAGEEGWKLYYAQNLKRQKRSIIRRTHRNLTGGGRNWGGEVCASLCVYVFIYKEKWELLVFLKTANVSFAVKTLHQHMGYFVMSNIFFYKQIKYSTFNLILGHDLSTCSSWLPHVVLGKGGGAPLKSPLSSTIYIISGRPVQTQNQTCCILLSHENGWLNNWINQPLFKWLEM